MPTNPTLIQMAKILADLRRERQAHVDAIAQIDGAFAEFQIPVDNGAAAVAAPRNPGRSKKSAAAKQPAPAAPAAAAKGRRTFKQTGDQFILSMLDSPKPTAAIMQAWKKSGRGGTAGNALTRLVKDGNVVRENVQGVRGSVYRKV